MLLKVIKLSLLLILTFLMLFPAPSLALGLGVSPSRLDFSIDSGSIARETLHVINDSDEEAQFQVYVEGKYKKWVSITPRQFTLSPNLSEDVEIAVEPPLDTSGEHDFAVCIVSLSPDSGLCLGAGIKVPARIQIVGNVPEHVANVEEKVAEFSLAVILAFGVVVILIVILGVLAWRRL